MTERNNEVNSSQNNSLEIAMEITIIVNKLNEIRKMIEDKDNLGLSNDVKEGLKKQFWVIVEELRQKLNGIWIKK